MTDAVVVAALVGLVGLVGGTVSGRVMTGRLTAFEHRYADEQGIRPLGFRWVPVAMALAACLVGAAQARVGGLVHGLVYAALTLPLVVLAAIDLDVHRLPDRWTLPVFAASAAGMLLVALVRGAWHGLLVAVLCAAAVGAFYLALAVVAGGRGFGLGDVKLSPSLGLLLGFNGAVQAALGTLLGFVSASCVAVALVLFAGAGRKTAIAFGPHMVLGCLVVLALPVVGALSGE